MPRKFLIPLLAAAFLVAPAMLPSSLVSSMTPGFSGAAQAKNTTMNVSKSTSLRMGGGGGTRTKKAGTGTQTQRLINISIKNK